MEYLYAALILHESDEEINEQNLTSVLEAANIDVSSSHIKALVAALEDEDMDSIIGDAAKESPENVSAESESFDDDSFGEDSDKDVDVEVGDGEFEDGLDDDGEFDDSALSDEFGDELDEGDDGDDGGFF